MANLIGVVRPIGKGNKYLRSLPEFVFSNPDNEILLMDLYERKIIGLDYISRVKQTPSYVFLTTLIENTVDVGNTDCKFFS